MGALRKTLLYATTFVVATYCVSVLYLVQTGWYLGLRGLFADASAAPSEAGMSIGWSDDVIAAGLVRPQKGDNLERVGGGSIDSALHLQQRVDEASPAAVRDDLARVSHVDELPNLAPEVTVADVAGTRWVRVDYVHFQRNERGETERLKQSAWLRLQRSSATAVWLSLVWFLLEMGIFAIGALVVWKRPGDRSALLFFLLCTVNVVAFMGAFHWPTLTGSKWLIYPFVFCALLLAPMTLHFFAVFPRPLGIIRKQPMLSTAVIYAVPGMWMLLLFYQIARLDRLYFDPQAIGELTTLLGRLAATIYGYLAASVGMYLVGFGVLVYRFLRGRTMQERQQVQGLLGAVMLTTGPVGYLLWTALGSRAEFAFGPTPKLMVYVTSLIFTTAYALSITRYKLLQVGRLVNRGILYVGISSLATVLFLMMVGLAMALVGEYYFRLENALAAGLTAMVIVVCLGWIRDRFQKSLDRNFYREKYRLDKAVRQLGAAVERLVEPAQLARQLLQGARDTIGATRGVVYLRGVGDDDFAVADHVNWQQAPARLPAADPLVADLALVGMLKRGGTGTAARAMQAFGADLGFLLELEGTVLGAAFFGPREDGLPYTPEDQNFVSTLARTTTLALSTAQGHRMILSLKEELQSKVDKISEQQRRIMFLQGELLNRGDQEQRADEPRPSREAEPPTDEWSDEIIGSSPAIRELLDRAAKVAQSSASVMVRGESGTGKELLARAIHRRSPRKAKPFVAVHCAALSSSLLESELFGHVKGAFTGADREKIGRFEMADGGTLFLDEIGDISLDTQTKLLRVLQDRTFERVGGVQTQSVDVRLVAATHQNLEDLIRQGRFREDLYYRLNVISLRCPSLRERREDVFELSLYFLRAAARRQGKTLARLDDDAVEALTHYDWPGNIRQLENVIERAVVLSESDSIRVDDLPPEISAAPKQTKSIAAIPPSIGPRNRIPRRSLSPLSGGGGTALVETIVSPAVVLHDELDSLERERLSEALVRAQGNKAEAARLLGIPRSTLFSKLRKYGLDG